MTERRRRVNEGSPISFRFSSATIERYILTSASRIAVKFSSRSIVMRALGRFLQVASLALLPLAFPLQLFGWMGSSLSPMLLIMIGAFCMFYIGRLIEGYASRA